MPLSTACTQRSSRRFLGNHGQADCLVGLKDASERAGWKTTKLPLGTHQPKLGLESEGGGPVFERTMTRAKIVAACSVEPPVFRRWISPRQTVCEKACRGPSCFRRRGKKPGWSTHTSPGRAERSEQLNSYLRTVARVSKYLRPPKCVRGAPPCRRRTGHRDCSRSFAWGQPCAGPCFGAKERKGHPL